MYVPYLSVSVIYLESHTIRMAKRALQSVISLRSNWFFGWIWSCTLYLLNQWAVTWLMMISVYGWVPLFRTLAEQPMIWKRWFQLPVSRRDQRAGHVFCLKITKYNEALEWRSLIWPASNLDARALHCRSMRFFSLEDYGSQMRLE